MVVSTSIISDRETGESIEIELPLKRREFRLLKVAWPVMGRAFESDRVNDNPIVPLLGILT